MHAILDLCRDVGIRDYEPGSVLLSELETSGHLCVLKAGAVEVLRRTTQVAVVEEPGAVFGEVGAAQTAAHGDGLRAKQHICLCL